MKVASERGFSENVILSAQSGTNATQYLMLMIGGDGFRGYICA